MEEPGQRTPTPQIIDDPKLRSPLRNFFESSVTAALWAGWLYFILPLVTLFLWAISLREGYRAVFMAHGLWELFQVLRMAGWVFLLIFSINLVWVIYNIHYVAGRPKVAKKRTYQVVLRVVGIEEVGSHNRIELVLDADGPKIASTSSL